MEVTLQNRSGQLEIARRHLDEDGVFGEVAHAYKLKSGCGYTLKFKMLDYIAECDNDQWVFTLTAEANEERPCEKKHCEKKIYASHWSLSQPKILLQCFEMGKSLYLGGKGSEVTLYLHKEPMVDCDLCNAFILKVVHRGCHSGANYRIFFPILLRSGVDDDDDHES